MTSWTSTREHTLSYGGESYVTTTLRGQGRLLHIEMEMHTSLLRIIMKG